MHKRLSLVLAVLVVGCSSEVATAPLVAKVQQIAGWGDSMTFGTGAPDGEGYTSDLSGDLSRAVFNGGVPGETSTQIRTRVQADTTHRHDVTVFWMGTNNAYDVSTILSDVAQSVATLGSNTHFLVLPVMNRPYEYAGRAEYNIIMSVNDSLKSRYQGHFVDVRAILISHYDSTSAQDVSDHAQDVPPTSLRFDTVHPNARGYEIIARTLADTITAKGW
jgi:lysophospholipase L1-like esterase